MSDPNSLGAIVQAASEQRDYLSKISAPEPEFSMNRRIVKQTPAEAISLKIRASAHAAVEDDLIQLALTRFKSTERRKQENIERIIEEVNRCNAIVASALLKSLIDFPRDQGARP